MSASMGATMARLGGSDGGYDDSNDSVAQQAKARQRLATEVSAWRAEALRRQARRAAKRELKRSGKQQEQSGGLKRAAENSSGERESMGR